MRKNICGILSFFSNCGLLLWLVRVQHDHYESKMLLRPGCRGDFRWNVSREKLGTQLRISIHGPLRPPSLGIPWLGMILILPLGILVQVHWSGYFLRRRPPQPPQSSETLAWSGWPESHLTLLTAERPPKHGEFFGGFSRWNFSASQQVLRDTPKNPCKLLYKQFLQTLRAEICAKEIGQKTVQKISAENPCKKPVQKPRAKNARKKKSVQKVRAENPCRSPCKTSVRNKPVQTASPK